MACTTVSAWSSGPATPDSALWICPARPPVLEPSRDDGGEPPPGRAEHTAPLHMHTDLYFERGAAASRAPQRLPRRPLAAAASAISAQLYDAILRSALGYVTMADCVPTIVIGGQAAACLAAEEPQRFWRRSTVVLTEWLPCGGYHPLSVSQCRRWRLVGRWTSNQIEENATEAEAVGGTWNVQHLLDLFSYPCECHSHLPQLPLLIQQDHDY